MFPTRQTTGRPGLALAIAALAVSLLAASVQGAAAHGFKIGAIEIGHPWSRATPPGAKVAGGYFTLTNEGDTPDRLISARVEGVGRAELHEMAVQDGVMTMRPLADGVVLAPHQTVKLAPSGIHLMLFELKQPLVAGTKLKGTLTFEKAGSVEVVFDVDKIGATGAEHDGADGMNSMPGMKMD